MPHPDSDAAYHAAIDAELSLFIDQHRGMLLDSLDGLSQAESRAALVPSETTLLGLVKHATFVEGVRFGEAVTGSSRADLGIPADPDESFDLTDQDTIACVSATYAEVVRQSRAAVANLSLDDTLPGNRRGPLPLRWVYLHVLRELAQHCGHADILHEQILAQRHR